MFRITEQHTAEGVVLKLEGRLSREWVAQVDACWRAAKAHDAGTVSVDLTDVCIVDDAGEALLARMHREGARFLTRGCFMRELIHDLSSRRTARCAEPAGVPRRSTQLESSER